ncbi:hypothetical protein FPV67DRAFT_1092627 [Lyophyllum atratum]|nr:hypothetical protein FPV67DRAFT_1092627 [Lyophyllum atratum]
MGLGGLIPSRTIAYRTRTRTRSRFDIYPCTVDYFIMTITILYNASLPLPLSFPFSLPLFLSLSFYLSHPRQQYPRTHSLKRTDHRLDHILKRTRHHIYIYTLHTYISLLLSYLVS